MKRWRFFFHYNKHTDGITVHFRGRCVPVTHVHCQVRCGSKWNKTQPRLVMQGFAQDVQIVNGVAIIS